MPRGPSSALLVSAKHRLDGLTYYRRPVRIGAVWLVSTPWLFRLPWLRRFDGYATHFVIFLRSSLAAAGEDLVTHELCHVWQMQDRPFGMPASYVRGGYDDNPYEHEAREAVRESAAAGAAGTSG